MAETGEPRYGSEKSGLLCGYMFSPGGAGQPIDPDDIAGIIAAHASATSDTFIWLHFNLSNQASVRWIGQHLSPPDAFQSAFPAGASTRVELEDGSLIAVLNDVRLFGLDAAVATMMLWVEGRVMVSARHTPLRSVDRLRRAVMAGEPFRSPVEMLSHLLRDQADVFVEILRDATARIDQIEDGVLARRLEATRTTLGTLRRMLVRLQRLLAPEPAALIRLLNRPRWITPDDAQSLQQAADEFSAAVADSVTLNERIRLLQEELSALVNEQTNRTLFVLTVVTVIALPMTIISGLLGMNVGGLPLQHGWGFWVAVGIVSVLSGGAAITAFRRPPP